MRIDVYIIYVYITNTRTESAPFSIDWHVTTYPAEYLVHAKRRNDLVRFAIEL